MTDTHLLFHTVEDPAWQFANLNSTTNERIIQLSVERTHQFEMLLGLDPRVIVSRMMDLPANSMVALVIYLHAIRQTIQFAWSG